MPLCNWHTFWMAPYLICYFIAILFYIGRKWLLLRNLTRILSLKSQLSGKFQCFDSIDGNIEMLEKSYEVQTAIHLKELIQPSPIPSPPHLTSASRIHFLDVKKWLNANNLSDTKEKHVCWKICKVRKAFYWVSGAYCF